MLYGYGAEYGQGSFTLHYVAAAAAALAGAQLAKDLRMVS